MAPNQRTCNWGLFSGLEFRHWLKGLSLFIVDSLVLLTSALLKLLSSVNPRSVLFPKIIKWTVWSRTIELQYYYTIGLHQIWHHQLLPIGIYRSSENGASRQLVARGSPNFTQSSRTTSPQNFEKTVQNAASDGFGSKFSGATFCLPHQLVGVLFSSIAQEAGGTIILSCCDTWEPSYRPIFDFNNLINLNIFSSCYSTSTCLQTLAFQCEKGRNLVLE